MLGWKDEKDPDWTVVEDGDGELFGENSFLRRRLEPGIVFEVRGIRLMYGIGVVMSAVGSPKTRR